VRERDREREREREREICAADASCSAAAVSLLSSLLPLLMLFIQPLLIFYIKLPCTVGPFQLLTSSRPRTSSRRFMEVPRLRIKFNASTLENFGGCSPGQKQAAIPGFVSPDSQNYMQIVLKM
jgi:hypothetical protein